MRRQLCDGAPLPVVLRYHVPSTLRYGGSEPGPFCAFFLSSSQPACLPPDYVHLSFVSSQGEDFHRMLTIARLTALSLGDETMTAVHWDHMKDLEARVAARVQQLKVRATSGSSSSSNGSSGVAPAATVTGTAGGATPVSPGSQAGALNAIPENE